jgi:hypothetical protein
VLSYELKSVGTVHVATLVLVRITTFFTEADAPNGLAKGTERKALKEPFEFSRSPNSCLLTGVVFNNHRSTDEKERDVRAVSVLGVEADMRRAASHVTKIYSRRSYRPLIKGICPRPCLIGFKYSYATG